MEREVGGYAIERDSSSEPLRLTDVELPWSFAERDERLALLDTFLEDFVFHAAVMRRQWGMSELACLGLAFAGMVLGAWDLGIGELAGGGDYNRVGFSGFRTLADYSLILALLSMIAWAGVLLTMWSRYPIMRENLVYLGIAMLAVQIGSISAHAQSPDFPYGSAARDWGMLGMANLVLLFLSIVVVHRAVIETRDVHVEERHAHPDPRVVQKAWRDHSLRAWSLSLGSWMILVNLMAWSGAHAISDRPPIEDYSNLVVAMFVVTGFLSAGFLMHILWYPQFMLGAAEDRIQSVRAREVAGELPEAGPKAEQGKCPICGDDTPAVRHSTGRIEVPCTSDCSGLGKPGTPCPECDSLLPTRIACPSCNSNTTIVSQFSRSEAW
ncbi:hypothetical protein [Candidatus Thalassarchaeum betae]|uniref:hypothetical protein n=1 Tax=Candidatus Thalassarchaeum betae TaxID=2599289 RepID=UPI0030C69F0E|nr:hypothetical protein [Candidatus Thalassoarchaea betae]